MFLTPALIQTQDRPSIENVQKYNKYDITTPLLTMKRKTHCVYAAATYAAVACGVVVVAMISVYVIQTNYTHQHRHHAITRCYDGMAHAQTKRTVTPQVKSTVTPYWHCQPHFHLIFCFEV
jgi:hypothetical protein